MNRTDLQNIAQLRVKEAKVLLDNQCYEGAYYLLGYAIECALKACIAKQTQRYDFPDKKLANDSYIHDLEKLLNVSGLRVKHQAQVKADPNFEVNWATVKDWKEDKRYAVSIPEATARDFYTAVTQRRHGVLAWLKTLW